VSGTVPEPTSRPLDGGAIVGGVLREQRVDHLFAISGGHILPILANLRNNDVKLIHMRHEQACAYAADAYARTTGRVGVCCVTAGRGLTNAVTGLCAAGASGSAVVCIAGQHPTTEDGRGSFQEAYAVEICRSFSKHTKRVVDWSTIAFDLDRAFAEAISPPQGPAVVEIPTDILFQGGDPGRQREVQGGSTDSLHAPADPALIERLLELLLAAQRPLLVAGDGVFWSQSGAELAEVVDRFKIPVYTRRAGRGAVSEDHPLAVCGSWKMPFTGRADLIVAVGFRYWSGERFGQPPLWNPQATYVQIDAVAARSGSPVPVALALAGNPKVVLRQLLDRAQGLDIDRSGQDASSWCREVMQARGDNDQAIDARERRVRLATPVHPDTLARVLCELMDADATVVLDSFTLSGWLTQWLRARFPGQILDGGPLAPVGHGVGMAIGAQLARPTKQVVLVIGDGGLGIGGWDIETALRYQLPIVTVLWNNSSWGPSLDQMPMLRGRTDPFHMLPGIRYDQMFAVLGCHTEHVENPDALRPALQRALAAGRTSLVDVVGDPRIGHPPALAYGSGSVPA